MSQFNKRRESSGLTQALVAKSLGLKDKSTIAKWETGASLPRTDLLPKIAELYSCTVDDLLSNSENGAKPA